jgi:hypothetical protein
MLVVISYTNSCIGVTDCEYCIFLHTNISYNINAFVAGGNGVENEKGGRATK